MSAQGPVLSTPGSATWETEVIPGGFKTIFTIRENTVLDWNTLNLPTGSQLVFDFLGGDSVLNYLGGTSTNRIDGTVTSNGTVAFISPDADLVVGGEITAGGVILSTLDVDPGALFSGQGFQMAASGAARDLLVRGTITATSGDLLLASEHVVVTRSADLSAARAVRIAGTSDLDVAASGQARLGSRSDDGFVLHLGESRAPTIEVVAGGEIQHFGTLDAGEGKIFLEVGKSGTVSAGGGAVIIGEKAFDGVIQAADVFLELDFEGDSAPAVSDATLKLPTVKRPDGSTAMKARTVSYTAPMSASADADRDSRKKSGTTIAGAGDRKPMLQRSSFFGMRGGSGKPAKR